MRPLVKRPLAIPAARALPGLTAAAALFLHALCGASPAAAAETRAFVLTSDFTNGSLSAADLTTHAVTRDVATVFSDARMRWFGGLLYVVNRFGQDNIQVVDPAAGFATLRQFSVGNGSNPQDIACVSPTKAYVTRLASSRLLIVNPSTGDSTGAIALAAFADADHVPDMDRMIRVGTTLFVELQRLANFQPTGPGVVVAIDTRADTVLDADPATPGTQAIVLPGANPTTTFEYDPASGRILVGCTGQYGANDGGIAWIDPATLTTGGYAITESALGGDVLDVVWGSATRSFAIVSDASFNTALVAWNPATGSSLGTIFSPGGFVLADAALDDRGELYVCDNDFAAPGLYVFAAATGAPLAGPLDTGLPPVEVAFDRSANVVAAPLPGVPAAGDAHALRLAAPWPQPASGAMRGRLALARAARVHVEILDLAGRSIRRLGDGEWAAGERELAWDLRDAGGRRVPPGVYVLFARAGEMSLSQRVVVTR
jgi:hypothetical protein